MKQINVNNFLAKKKSNENKNKLINYSLAKIRNNYTFSRITKYDLLSNYRVTISIGCECISVLTALYSVFVLKFTKTQIIGLVWINKAVYCMCCWWMTRSLIHMTQQFLTSPHIYKDIDTRVRRIKCQHEILFHYKNDQNEFTQKGFTNLNMK